ncbi:hypothetical protein ACQP1P_15780 [Dactylosporangium sp. CA-052675]|uniref:hypothetical protein n=1 Tax=Dactylosporangium sp. CA-052675 TaxID=3239927 RepID=UPI003D9061F4
MTSEPVAQAGTALSPEWDRGFDEAFTELICSDPDLVRAEFDALIGADFDEPPPPRPPAPPAPSAQPRPAHAQPDPSPTSTAKDGGARGAAGPDPRSPP